MDNNALSPGSPLPPASSGIKLRRHLIAVARWFAAMVILPIVIGAIVLAVLVNSTRFHSYLLNTLETQATNSLGVRVKVQNFTPHVSALSVDLYGITIDGASPYPNPPLLQVQHVQAGVRIVSILERKWYFDSIRVDGPVIQVFIDKHGVSNIPTLKSSGSGNNTTIFDLGIRHAVIDNGVVFYNDQPTALAVDLHNVDLNAAFNSLLQKYSGTLAYTEGHLTYGSVRPPPHSVNLRFDATPTTLHLSPAKLTCGNSQLNLNATLTNYTAPAIEAQYIALVDGGQLAEILHNASIPVGQISATGSAQYQYAANRPLLETLMLKGELTSRQLIVKSGTAKTPFANVTAHISLANGDAILHDLRSNIFGGELKAQGTMKSIAGNSNSRVEATLRGASLSDIRRIFANTGSAAGVAVAGTLNAGATASWGKTLDDLVAHTDATIDSNVANSRHGTEHPPAPAPVNLQGQAPGANSVPVEGAIHATYFAKGQRLAVENSFLRTAQTSLAMSGVVSSKSSLDLQLQANDLREVEAIADIFRTVPPGQSLQPFGLAGSASFHGVVQGSTAAPHLTGQLAAQNLQFNGTTWKVLHTHVDLSPSRVSLQQGDLEPTTRGKITFNATAELHDWSFSSSTPVEVQLNASQIDVAEIEKLTGQQIPVTGTLSANLQMHGSALNPIGSGDFALSNATAYDEPFSEARVTFTGTGREAHADLSLRSPAGSLQGKVSIRPNERTYAAQLSSTGIQLEKLHALIASGSDATGTAAFSATGQGTFDNPQLDATLQMPTLVVQHQSITGIKLQANLSNHVATAELTSSAVNSSIKANARVSLTGDFPADATLDTQSIPLGPLLAVYAPEQAADINGHTELHATLHGPLKRKDLLEAHVTVPVLNLTYGYTVSLAAASPIHVDYKNGIIDVQRSSIHGTDTDLQFQGSVPVIGNAPMSLLLMGTVNLHLAQMFDPDLKSSGQLKFNLNSYGAKDSADIGGDIEIVDANVSMIDLPVALQHANGALTLTRDRINISKFQATMGGGQVTAQGGIALRPAIHFDLGMAAKGVRLLYPQGMREGIDANLRFTGSKDSSLLGGSVNLTDLSFTPAFDLTEFIDQFSGGIPAPPSQSFSQNVALNLAVHSSNNVNLVSRTLSVNGSANLQVRGTAAEPVILGRANLTGGDIILNGSRFVLTGGTVQFINPLQTQPVVNLTLNTTIQQYNISMRFEGPVEQLRTQYTSDPSLPSADIISLLAFGKTTEASANSTTTGTQAAQSMIASQVSSQFTSRVSKIAGISQLSINPVLAGSSNQGTPGANITIQQRVTGNLFITFSTNVASTQGQTIQGQYQVTPRVAVSVTGDQNGGFAFDTLIKKSW
jgi:translocation and assembly module TamB